MNNTCTSGKRSYPDYEIALEALIQFHIINHLKVGQGPQGLYACDICQNWHFTSKGDHDVLNDPDILERIHKERIANQWERKLR